MKTYLCVCFCAVLFMRIRADCDYRDALGHFDGLKLSKIPNGYMITNNNKTTIPSGGNIVWFCDERFQFHNYRNDETTTIGKLLTISCDGSDLRFSTESISNQKIPDNQYRDSSQRWIKCNSVSKFHGAKLDYCEYKGLRQGISVDHVPIVSLELCYDFNNSEPIFVHYVAAQRSLLLERQHDYNPSTVSEHNLDSKDTVNLEEQTRPEIELENDRSLFLPNSKHLLSEINYTYEELASSNLYATLNVGIFKYEFNTLKSVPWWTPLRVGNWKIFENLMSRQLETESYDIYAGKSNLAYFPKGFVCNSETSMVFEVEGRKQHIPLYIWNYVKPRNTVDHDEEFVLIGINSPFVESDGNNLLVICEDICDTIPWLQPLMATRKISSFGYIFCCKPKDVYFLLDGFPRFSEFQKIEVFRNQNITSVNSSKKLSLRR